MINRIDQEMRFSQVALNLRAHRQEMLASNIANADTPHYKARDFNFKDALNGALGGASGAGRAEEGGMLAVAQTSARHLAASGMDGLGVQAQYRGEQQSSVDGNTVNMDVERAAFAENAIHLEALITFVNARFKTLSSAIQSS